MSDQTMYIGDGQRGRLVFPLSFVTTTQSILAQKGAGKTYTAIVQMEELLAAGQQCVALDPTGVWWGIRSPKSGARQDYRVIIFGGEYGDVPLAPDAGEIVADWLVDTGQSAILDVSLFESNSAQDRFATAFAERLYRRKAKHKSPVHLFIDEADSFCPQRPMPGQQRMLGAFEAIVRRGRSRGLGITLISQRPAILNKNVLTQTELMTCLRIVSPQDQKAVQEWINVHGDPERRKMMMESLASLPKGAAWFWSPAWLDIFERAQVRKRKTFDSSGTPEPGTAPAVPKKLAPMDLEGLSAQIKATIAEREANDPKALKRKISDLQKQVADLEHKRSAAESRVETRTVEVPMLAKGELQQLKDAAASVSESIGRLQAIAGNLERGIALAAQSRTQPTATPHRGALSGGRICVPPRPQESPYPRRQAASHDNGRLAKAERLILTALAQHGPSTKAKVAIIAGYAMNGGGFNNAVSALRRAAPGPLVLGNGDHLEITGAGRSALGEYEPLPTGRDLLQWWHGTLPKAESEILAVLDSAKEPLSKEEIAAQTTSQYAADGGGFNNALSRLRTLGLINRGAHIELCEELR